MKVLLRVGATGLVGSVAMALFALVLLPWVGGPALFGSAIGQVYRSLLDEQVRTADLLTRDEAVKRSLDGKQEVTAGLIDGRLSLQEAAERFERLASERSDYEDDLPPTVQLSGDRSRTYRQVIQWAATALFRRPQERGAILARLERERVRLEHGAKRPVH